MTLALREQKLISQFKEFIQFRRTIIDLLFAEGNPQLSELIELSNGIDFSNKLFYECHFNGLSFENVNITNTTFEKCEFFYFNIRPTEQTGIKDLQKLQIGSVIEIPAFKGASEFAVVTSIRNVQENQSFKESSGYVFYATLYSLTHNMIYNNCAFGNSSYMNGDFIKIGEMATLFYVIQ